MKDLPSTTVPSHFSRTSDRFRDLYEAHAPGAMKLALVLTGGRRELAQDLVHDAFVRLLRRFRDRCTPDSFERYLRATVVNLARTRWRRLGRRALTRLDGSHEREVTDHASEVALSATLWAQIIRLPPRQRAALFLRYYEDRPLREVATCLDCSEAAAKSLLHNALKKLRDDKGVMKDE